MSTVILSDTTYGLLRRKAQAQARTPDQLADELLRRELLPQHAYIEIVERPGGPCAMIKGTRIAVRDIISYVRSGETAETLARNVLPHLTLAQVYDALSYYDDHAAEIDRELELNTEEHARRVLRDSLGEEGYQHVTGQKS